MFFFITRKPCVQASQAKWSETANEAGRQPPEERRGWMTWTHEGKVRSQSIRSVSLLEAIILFGVKISAFDAGLATDDDVPPG